MKLSTLLLPITLVSASPMALDPRAVNYLSVINQWRVKGDLPKVTVSQKLVTNAHNARIKAGSFLTHTLYPGTFAQVAARVGDHNPLPDFPEIYVQYWLCERPSLTYLKGVCTGVASKDETGHSIIVTDPKYRQVGCSFGGVPDSTDGFIYCDWA